MFISALIAFLLFPMARVLGSERMKRIIHPMIKLILIPNMVFYAWCIFQYFQANEVVFPSGAALRMVEYSMEIGINRNITGAFGLLMLMVCFYLTVSEKGWHRIPYLIGVVVYTVIMILSNCRTSWYTALLFFFMAGYFLAWNLLRGKDLLLRISIGVLFSLTAVLLLHWFRSELFLLLEASVARVTAAQAAAVAAYPAKGAMIMPLTSHLPETASALPLASESNEYIRSGLTDLSGRKELYQAAIYVMSHSEYCFLFGVTPSDVGIYMYGLYGVQKLQPHVHNLFLQMGLSYGVPTMLATIAFAGSLVFRSIRLLFSKKAVLSPGFWMIPIICLCLLTQDMTEVYLNAGDTLVCSFFYLFAGWIVATDCDRRDA
jgi:hypothetical protein